jgi:hypothetical protein
MPTYTQSSIYDTMLGVLHHPAVKGSVIGTGVMFLATPGINRVNHGSKMLWSEAYVGWKPLVATGIVSCATSFYVKDMLGGNEKNASTFQQFWTSAVAGAISGIPLCPLEAINKNQTKNVSMADTIKSIYQHHGSIGFFKGTNTMMVRESAWMMMCMTTVSEISKNLCQQGYNQTTAEAFALIFSACVFGFVSAPVNHLRIMKQENLTIAGQKPSYSKLASTLFHGNGNRTFSQSLASCFKDAGVRSLTSAWAGGLFYYGKKYWEENVPKPSYKP